VKILILAEYGRTVGTGHLVRSGLLRRALSQIYDIQMIAVKERLLGNLESIADKLSAEYDVVLFDGIQFNNKTISQVTTQKSISLSYVSDINSFTDLVIAPALFGQKNLFRTLTDVKFLIFHLLERSSQKLVSGYRANSKKKRALVYSWFGGTDTDSLSKITELQLMSQGYDCLIGSQYIMEADLEERARKWSSLKKIEMPHQGALDADYIITQAGLSAVELVALKKPTIVRYRSDFPKAYDFLAEFSWVRFIEDVELKQARYSEIFSEIEKRRKVNESSAANQLFSKLYIEDRAVIWHQLFLEIQKDLEGYHEYNNKL